MSVEADIAAVRRALRCVPAGPDRVEGERAFERLVPLVRDAYLRDRSEEPTKETPT